MGKHSAPVAPSPKGKKKIFVLLPVLIAVLIGTVIAVIFFSADPNASLLEQAGISFESCETEQDTVYLTLQGDAEGILQCRKALNTLRSAEDTPNTLCWTLRNGTEEILHGTEEDLSYIPRPTSSRVETLTEELTLLKLKYELEQSGLKVSVTTTPSEGVEGKTLTVTVDTTRDGAVNALKTVPAAVHAVNEEGGGIVRYDVRFLEHGALIAAASYDLCYGDALFSTLLQ